MLSKPTSSEIFPPTRLYLLNGSANLKQCQLHEPVGEISHSNHHNLQVGMEEV